MRVLLSRNLILAFGMIFILAFATPTVLAHGGEEADIIEEIEEQTLEDIILEYSLNSIIIGSIIITVSTLVSILHRTKTEIFKIILFLSIVIPVIVVTAFVAGGTIYLNLNSDTGGPVHWHADFEVWSCENEIDIIDAEGITNRVGSSTLHDHGDNRIHVEGVLIDKSDADLHAFFDVIGGTMVENFISVPTNEGIVTLIDGEQCDGNEARFQVFVYRVINPDNLKNWEYVQEKITGDPSEYVLAPYSTIPPGDCFIIELDEEKDRTDRICETMKVAIDKGELREAQ